MLTNLGAAPPEDARRQTPPQAPGAQPPARLPWLLRRVNQRYRAEVVGALEEAGFGKIPQPGYWALMAAAGGASDARHLVSVMGVSKQAVSKVVESLVAGGFLERRPHGADRRKIDLLLTQKGRRAVEAIEAAVDRTDRRLAAELGSTSLDRLQRMLERLADPAPRPHRP